MERGEKNQLPGQLLQRAFFEATPERVARRLLGKILVRRTKGHEPIAGRIVEVEAYLGPHQQTADRAAHSHRGPTPRNEVLFGPAGHAYVYFIYGMYFCMNVSCERVGHGGGVLLRALEPVAGLEQMARNREAGSKGAREQGSKKTLFAVNVRRGWATDEECRSLRELTSGPGRLCEALGITRSEDNGLDLTDPKSPLQLRDDGTRAGRVLVTPRIGIRHASDLPLRFIVAGNGCVSGPKALNG